MHKSHIAPNTFTLLFACEAEAREPQQSPSSLRKFPRAPKHNWAVFRTEARYRKAPGGHIRLCLSLES